MKKNILIVCIIWTALTAASFLWNYKNSVNELRLLALQSARSNFQQIVLFRAWNAKHGGVYVPVDADTQPNPYLQSPDRDIRISNKLTLTMINPAFMTRQVSEIASKRDGVKFHITSLMPIRPENRATQLEEIALKEFESGVTEKGEIIKSGGMDVFFYMAPLMTESSCLKCHAKQGYKEGDIRGGISILLPFVPKIPLFMLITGHLFILAAGLTGIIFSGMKLANAYAVIRRQAVFDALTGIPNRYSFSERILTEFNRSLRDNYPLSVIMGDIDHFKFYNDTYGHAKGDECLRNVAQTIEKTLKRPGDFCARYGGEEFIIILPATDQKGALKIAGEILENVRGLNIPHEKSLPAKKITISLGIATKETSMKFSYDDLLKMADDALYIAKSKGRDTAEEYKINFSPLAYDSKKPEERM
jgi:diguanylate cyclase (GGDEF)-like protein